MISNTRINQAGQVAFRAELSDTIGGPTNMERIYRADADGLVELARTGQPAPSGPGEFVKLSVGVSINDSGQVLYRAALAGSGVDLGNDVGIYLSDGTDTVELVREGQSVPEGPGQYERLQSGVRFNNAGQGLFQAVLSGEGVDSRNNYGIFLSDDAGTHQVARTGMDAPDGLGQLTDIDFGVSLNETGQAVFAASLSGTGVRTTNNQALYLYDSAFGLVTVARKGDAFMDSTITDLEFAYSSLALGDGLNNLGQVAYGYTLADGESGIAVFSLLGAALAGDYNANGVVDAADYTVWQDNFGSTTTLAADGNGNGIIDAADYTVWQDNFGAMNNAAETTAIPEPGTFLGLASLIGGFGLRRPSRP